MLNSFEATVQRYNALVHQEPWSFVSYFFFWLLFWTIATPVVLWMLTIQLVINLFHHYVWESKTVDPKATPDIELAIVVTGCDSGFGKDLVWEVAREGFTVFAGCLNEASLEQFQLEPRIIPIKMDVTSDGDVQAVVERVNKWLNNNEEGGKAEDRSPRKKRYLHALVNNAGLAVTGLIDWLDMASFEKQMQVNFFGMVRTCKAFLPIFKDQAPRHSPRHYSDARIINMISAAGLNAFGAPGGVGYEASKNAAEAFTASLRWEMKKLWNVDVTAINPTFHETAMVSTVFDNFTNTWNQLSPELREDYGQVYFDHLKAFLTVNVLRFVWPAHIVSEQVVKCIKASNPPAQLIVGMDGKFGLTVGRLIPAWARTMFLIEFERHAVKPAKMRA